MHMHSLLFSEGLKYMYSLLFSEELKLCTCSEAIYIRWVSNCTGRVFYLDTLLFSLHSPDHWHSPSRYRHSPSGMGKDTGSGVGSG